ncbi:hypothetical protein SAMN02949497_1672 [Methylomagnum ishizawai]|uniref:Calx-beta domain-containing protein n=1 Tax=Methylomagnum ishizawai TaxID=1760988 RepID=A0A1Y6CVD0_9GAMM|nr:hypothetical protein [Methylomagnum ishizawai]SMF94361.1 hypothetical protein SAMN02949497_1672 [Methylomagnum ishizawai]
MACSIGTASAIGTIRNDDVGLSVSNLVADGDEGDSGTTELSFTIDRVGYLDRDVSVDWAVVPADTDSADAADFVGGVFPSGSVTLSAGEASTVIVVPVQGDTDVEPDEFFVVELSNPVGCTLMGDGEGAIYNDDTGGNVLSGEILLFSIYNGTF